MTEKKFRNVRHKEELVLFGTSLGLLFGFLFYIFSGNESNLIIGFLIGFSIGSIFTKLYLCSNDREKEGN